MEGEDRLRIVCGDALGSLRGLADESVQCGVCSPPYWGLRDYGVEGQLGLEKTPEEYVSKMVEVFREVRRVLRNDGTLWLNLGDSYNAYNGGAGPSSKLSRGAQTTERPQLESGYGLKCKGLKPKDLVGIPWMVAFALRADGWYLRQDIIWSKPNPMPESVTDRCTKAHEYLFLLSKSPRYYYDAEAIAEPCDTPIDSKARCGFGSENGKCNTMEFSHSNETGKRWEKSETRNKRSVWEVTTQPFPDAHFATYPPDLIKPCILAGTKSGDTVLDPFAGSGTTGMVALELGRKALLIELNPEYVKLIERRCDVTPGFAM